MLVPNHNISTPSYWLNRNLILDSHSWSPEDGSETQKQFWTWREPLFSLHKKQCKNWALLRDFWIASWCCDVCMMYLTCLGMGTRCKRRHRCCSSNRTKKQSRFLCSISMEVNLQNVWGWNSLDFGCTHLKRCRLSNRQQALEGDIVQGKYGIFWENCTVFDCLRDPTPSIPAAANVADIIDDVDSSSRSSSGEWT